MPIYHCSKLLISEELSILLIVIYGNITRPIYYF